MVKERPILFSAPMVRAILEGRKSMTRRIVKPQPITMPPSGYRMGDALQNPNNGKPMYCPYGHAGDRLWVRETFQPIFADGFNYSTADWQTGKGYAIQYVATDGRVEWMDPDDNITDRCKPGIHMPRWASRILLEITDVRVERLQEISEADAKAEGLSCLSKDGGRTYKFGIADDDGLPGKDDTGWHWADWEQDPRRAFFKLWDNIHGDEHGAGSNPWVWVVCFKRIE